MNPSFAASGRPRDRRLGVLFLTLFIDLAGFSIIFPLYPEMLRHYLEQGGNEGLFAGLMASLATFVPESVPDPEWVTTVFFGALLASFYSLAQFLSAPWWGRLSDRLGRRRVLLWTIAGTFASYLLWAFGNSFGLFIASRLLAGLFAGNLGVVTAAVADVTPPEKRSSGMAIIGVAFGLGFILGPVIGGLTSLLNLSGETPSASLFALHLFSVPALAAALLSLTNLLQAWRFLPETRPPERTEPEHLSSPARSALLKGLSRKPSSVKRIVFLYGFFILAFSGMEFTLTFLAVERLAFSPANNALLFVFIGAILLIVQGWFVRKFAHPIGERRLLVIGLALCGAGLALLGLAHSTGWFFLGLAFLGIGMGLASPLFTSLTSLYSAADNQGSNLGLMRGVGSLARAAGPLLTGVAFWLGGSLPAYLAGAFAMLVIAALCQFLPQPHKSVT